MIFGKFDELGSANAVLRFLRRESLQIGVRQPQGATSGLLEWRAPNRSTIYESCIIPSTREPMFSDVREQSQIRKFLASGNHVVDN
jgi:hypothetical protein